MCFRSFVKLKAWFCTPASQRFHIPLYDLVLFWKQSMCQSMEGARKLLNCEGLDLLFPSEWIRSSNAPAVGGPYVYLFSLSVTFLRNEIYIAPSGVQKERIQVHWIVFLPQSSSWDGWKYLYLEFPFSLCEVRNLLCYWLPYWNNWGFCPVLH